MSIPRKSELPKAMTSLPNWVVWRTETRAGSSKPTKVPYSLRDGGHARSNDPETWVAFPESSEVATGCDGIGFVLTKEAGITGIDLDHCLNADGGMKPWAVKICKEFQYTYSETSPSRTGVKIFARGALSGTGRKVFVDSDGNPTVESMADGAIEMYDTGRYFTVTGMALGPLDIADCQAQTITLYSHLQGTGRAAAVRPADGEIVTEGNRHNYLLSVAGKLRNAGFDREALLVAIRGLNDRCSPPKPERELVGIVDFLMAKPAKYRLMPADIMASQTADGVVVEFPQPATEPLPVPEPVTTDILVYTENLLVAALTAKSIELILGVGTAPSELVNALAQAGSIKQHEARRRIKDAKLDIPLRELDLRIKAAEIASRQLPGTSIFLLNDEGHMQTNLANAMKMVEDLPLQHNSFTCRSFLTTASPWESIGNWTDYDDARATEWCQRKELNVLQNIVATAADTIAKSRTPHYHPIRAYLNALKWDGEPRLDTWLVVYMGAKSSIYIRAVGRKWMISGVKRAYAAGCQADYTLVLEGPQGKLKSSGLRALCDNPEWFSDDITDMGSKDSAIQLQGKWIVELPELDAFRKTEQTTIKAFLVRRTDYFRPPYGRRAEDFPRQNIFAATTNKEDWLQDDTGGRRFWPVKVGEISIEAIIRDRDQLWAEAKFYHDEGEPCFLSETSEAIAKEEQRERQERDAWTDSVLTWITAPTVKITNGAYTALTSLDSDRDRIYLPEVLLYCIGLQPKDWNHQHKSRVARILRLAGYITKRSSRTDEDGKRREYWVKL